MMVYRSGWLSGVRTSFQRQTSRLNIQLFPHQPHIKYPRHHIASPGLKPDTYRILTLYQRGENHYLAYGFGRMMEIGAVDIVMPDLQKCGGLGEGQRIANLAELYYVPFAPHMVASFLGAMASAHVCASVPNFMIMEWQSYFHTQPMFRKIVTYDGEWVKDSFITVSDKPGIGVEINEAGMKKYAIPGVPFFE